MGRPFGQRWPGRSRALASADAKRRPAKKPKAAEPDVAVPVDAKLKKLYDRLLDQIHAAERTGASAWDALWESVAAIVEHKPALWPLGGFASVKEFFQTVTHETERTARRNMRVARFATPQEETRYGSSTLDAALGYLEAKVGHALEGRLPVAFERLKVPVKRDGATRELPLDEVTVADIAAATRALLKGKHRTAPNHVRDALHALITKASAALQGVRVHERDGFVSFTNVPVASLAAFGRAVASGKALSKVPSTRKSAKGRARRGK